MRVEAIRERAAHIRWRNKAIAAATGLSEMTIGRTLSEKTSPNLSTCETIEEALQAEEIALRDYLLALHPVSPASPGVVA